MTSLELLQQQHPDYDSRGIQRREALYQGGGLWRRLLTEWVPKNPAETVLDYQDRLQHVLYTNYTSAIVDMLASWLFEVEPNLGADVPESIQALQEDADGRGRPLGEVLAQVFTDALLHKKAYAWVDFPSAEGQEPASLLEQETRGLLEPYITCLKAENVLDWGEDDRGRLTWVKVYYRDLYKSGPLQPLKDRHRWILITETVVQRWEIQKNPGEVFAKDQSVPLVETVEHGVGRLPIVRMDLSPGLWAMSKLRDPAIRLLRLENDRDWGLHRSCNALLVQEIQDPNGMIGEEGEAPVVGPGQSLETSRKVYYVEPEGNGFQAMERAVQSALEAIHRVVHQMAMAQGASGAGGPASGASKRRDWEALQIVMSAYNRVVSEFVVNLVSFVASVVDGQEDYRPDVGGMNSWRRRTLEQFMEAVVLSVSAQTYSVTLQKEIAKKQAELLLGEDVSPDTLAEIFKEIDEAPPMGAAMDIMAKGLGDDVARNLDLSGDTDAFGEEDDQGTEARRGAQDSGSERGRNEV